MDKRQGNRSPNGKRPALILLRDGRSYEGVAEVDRCCIHADVRRRVHEAGGITYRAAGERIWPWSEVREVRWAV